MSSTFSSVDATELTFREPNKIEHGIILSTSGTFNDTSFQLPPMQVKFDPNVSDNGAVKIATAVTDPALVEWLKSVDAQVVQQLVEHSQEWFNTKKPLTEAVAVDRYSGLLNAKNPKYDPLIKMKLNDKSKHKPTEIFRLLEDGKSVQQCDVGDVHQGDIVTVIVRLTGLFVGSTGMVFPQIVVDEMLVEGDGGDATSALYSDVDPTCFQYTEPKKLDKGGDVVFVQDRTSFTFPEKMLVKFTPNEPENEGQGKKVALELSDEAFARWIQAVDAHNIDTLVANSEAWFGAPATREVVESRYTPLYRQKDSYTPLLTVRLRPSGKKSPTDIRTHDPNTEEPVSADDSVIRQGAHVTVTANLMGMYIINKNVYPALNADAMVVHPVHGGDATSALYSDVDPTRFQYTEPKKLDKGGDVVFVQDRTSFTFPEKMLVKFTPNEPENEGQGKKVALELSDEAFARWIQAVDAHNIDTLVANSEAWFGAPATREVVESRYTPLYRQKDSYTPLLTVRLRPSGKKSPTDIRTHDPNTEEPVSADDSVIRQGAHVTVTANLMGMYIINKNVYPALNADAMVVHPVQGGDATSALYSDVDPTRFQYTEPKKLDKGGDVVFVQDRTSFTFPEKMLVKFTPNEPENEGQGKKVALELSDEAFARWIQAVDAHNIDTLVVNSEAWFGAPATREVVESRYTPLYRQKDSYTPLLTVRLRPSGKKSPTDIRTHDPNTEEPVSADDSVIRQGAHVTVTANLMGMYIINKNVYPALNADAMVVHPVHGGGDESLGAQIYTDVDPTCFQYTDLTAKDGIGMTFTRDRVSFTLPDKMLLKFTPREPERKGQHMKIALEVLDSELVEWLKRVDAHNLDMIVANAEQWFGRPISRDIAESRYTPLLRQKDAYTPLLGVRIMGIDRSAPTLLSMIHEDGGEEIPCDELALDQGVRISATVKYVGMCLINKMNFYPLLNAEKLVIHPNTNKRRKLNFAERGLTFVDKPEPVVTASVVASAIPVVPE
jgi:lipopolysaccharide/colanic/teichoic acid biosynthesis glycosyltransferase